MALTQLQSAPLYERAVLAWGWEAEVAGTHSRSAARMPIVQPFRSVGEDGHSHRMDGSVALNLLAPIVSAGALGPSFVAAREQLMLAHHSNALTMVVDLIKETRTPEFSRWVEHIRDRPAADHRHQRASQASGSGEGAHPPRGAFYDDVGTFIATCRVD